MGVTAGVTRGITRAVSAAITGMGAVAEVPALLITDPNYTCDQCGDQGPGSVVMQGFASWDGHIDLQGYTYTSFVAQDVTATTNAILFSNDSGTATNPVTSIDMRSLVQNGSLIKFIGCPLSSINFDSLELVAGNHIYLSGANTTGTPDALTASFPALTQLDRALVFSRRTGLSSFSAPLLTTLNHELELDYCKALSSVDLSSLTTINYNGGLSGLVIGGDPTDLTGGTHPNALSTLALPSLTTIKGFLSVKDCRLLTTFDSSPWSTLGNGFSINFSRDNLTQGTMDAHFAKLAALVTAGSLTSGTVDYRFQLGGQLPSAAGQADAAILVAAGIRNSQGGTTLYA